MINEFSNETWCASAEKEYFTRTLKSIRYHHSLERLDGPTTALLFVSRLRDFPIRQHFEESSRHFKTYNVFNGLSALFDAPEVSSSSNLARTPFWLLSILDFALNLRILGFLLKPFLSHEYQEHFNYRAKLRSLTEEDLADELSGLMNLIGMTSFARLNVLIGPQEDRSLSFGIGYVCRALNDPTIKNLLSKSNILIPNDFQINYCLVDKHKNKMLYRASKPNLEINSPLLEYLERKTQWVLDRKKVKDLLEHSLPKKSQIVIIGRRVLTRGHNPLNESSFIQSYNDQGDADLQILQKILVKFLEAFRKTNSEALIVVENFPNQLSYLISRDDDLKRLLQGKSIALACIEPETKDIYAFEGKQFVQKNLKHIY